MPHHPVRVSRRALLVAAGAGAGVLLAGRAHAAGPPPTGGAAAPPPFDDMVLRAQRWLNATYAGRVNWKPVPEDGRTGQPTVEALVRALQYEVGLDPTQVNGNFGPTTFRLVTERIGMLAAGKPANVIKIAQCGLYCKGYPGEGVSGAWGSETGRSVGALRRDMGLAEPRSTLAPTEFRALLTMDAYQLLAGGAAAVRAVQQWLNRRYAAQPWYRIVACDGYAYRPSLAMLVSAVQRELGIAEPTGAVNAATRAALHQRPPIAVGQADGGAAGFVQLFLASLIFSRYDVPFGATFTAAAAAQARAFQEFAALPASGTGDAYTWASLLSANGDPGRPAHAADCSTRVTPARAAALRAAGVGVVGRYLTNATEAFNKKIQPGELADLFAAGLRVFPIYQTSADSAPYFTAARGRADGAAAVAAARGYGFRSDTVIYFAVDFDVFDHQITDGVVPYFTAVRAAVDAAGAPYRVGVYGVRHACSRLAAAGLTVSSFVADTAYGYTGNIGYPLPANWAFDQFANDVTVGTGDGAIDIDRNAASGRDPGQAAVDPPAAG
ncbi:hypothetical protein GCM10010124_34150 [Pilimelia terevasa]|uniref:Rv2525c-like glycoside hydrolase-like domain-containing protein n=1 Tax=Pilimelia terevasa TaxID=53372 RepID=A0A8J3BT90_9ACTN|nr:glycoside hydrolase domain-containing protein [Pilimelia terevasa]GGK38447.1 hypothetical protein GCM10010124_34150 [Pilimelia terevasa]